MSNLKSVTIELEFVILNYN